MASPNPYDPFNPQAGTIYIPPPVVTNPGQTVKSGAAGPPVDGGRTPKAGTLAIDPRSDKQIQAGINPNDWMDANAKPGWMNMDMPVYNPYEQTANLPGNKTYTPQKLGYMDFGSIFANQRNDLNKSMNRGFASNMNRVLSQGGAESGAMERLTTQNQVANAKAQGRLSSDQAEMQAKNMYDVDAYNTGAANQAQQFNIGNLISEGRFGHQSELAKFLKGMEVQGANATADAMAANSGGGGFNPFDPSTWFG